MGALHVARLVPFFRGRFLDSPVLLFGRPLAHGDAACRLTTRALPRRSAVRRRYQWRVLADRSADARLADFARLQQRSFRVLQASPRGYRHFLKRNLSARRVEVIDGVWRPVSPARGAQQA